MVAWQGGAEGEAAAAVPYDVAADDDAWAPAGTRSGIVVLAPSAVRVYSTLCRTQP